MNCYRTTIVFKLYRHSLRGAVTLSDILEFTTWVGVGGWMDGWVGGWVGGWMGGWVGGSGGWMNNININLWGKYLHTEEWIVKSYQALRPGNY